MQRHKGKNPGRLFFWERDCCANEPQARKACLSVLCNSEVERWVGKVEIDEGDENGGLFYYYYTKTLLNPTGSSFSLRIRIS